MTDVSTPVEVGTQLLDAEATRVDGVKGPATGLGFLVLKSLDDQTDATVAAALLDKTAVRKDDGTVGTVMLDGAVVNAIDQANEAPGSPQWEAQDSAALAEIAGQLAVLLTKINNSAARERAEVEAGADWGDIADAWNLDDAADLVDSALDLVAGMVYTEQVESETGGSVVAKSLRKPLSDTVKATIAKAYTTISTLVGETKGIIMSPEDIAALADAAVAKALAVKPAEAASVVTPEVASEAAVTDVAKGADSAPADVTPVVEPTPAEDIVKQMTDVFKSAVTDTLTAAMAEDGAVGSVLKSLDDRVSAWENKPAKGGPVLNGAAGAGFIAVRGGAAEASAGDEREALAKEMATASPARQAEIMTEMSRINLRNMYAGLPTA